MKKILISILLLFCFSTIRPQERRIEVKIIIEEGDCRTDTVRIWHYVYTIIGRIPVYYQDFEVIICD